MAIVYPIVCLLRMNIMLIRSMKMTKKNNQPMPCGAAKQEISDFAEKMSDILELQPGAELEPIVKQIGGRIEYLPLTGKESMKASITVKKVGEFTIRLFSILFPLQKRLSIAHELGHLFLHSKYGKIELEAFHDVENENEQAEDEAHEFACSLLMPTKILKNEINKFGKDSVQLAAVFMVPEPIARQRINDVSKG